MVIFRIETDADAGAGSIFQRVLFLLVGKYLGRFEIDAVDAVLITDDLSAVLVDLGIDDDSVRDPTVFKQMLAIVFRGDFFFASFEKI